MRIALSTSVIQRGKTGVAQYVLSLTRAMLAHADEHEFQLLVLEDDIPLFDFARQHMNIVPVSEKWRSAVSNILWHQLVLPSWLREQSIDVLHIPSYRRMLWHAPCATVATIHDLAPFHVKGKYDIARMFYGKVVVKHLARQQNRIVAVSSNTASDVESFFGVPSTKQDVVLNGLDHQRFHPAEAAKPEDEEAAYFLYVSRLEHPSKNHVRLIQAFNEFKTATGSNWQLHLGGSDWTGADVIHAAAKDSPFSQDIRFLGFVPDAELPSLYRGAGALVYPSLFEGFGMPPVEAMACGCPVISSAEGSLREVVGDAALIIDPHDVQTITRALIRIASSRATRLHLTKAGLANAQRFDWNKTAAQVLRCYQGAMNSYRNAVN